MLAPEANGQSITTCYNISPSVSQNLMELRWGGEFKYSQEFDILEFKLASMGAQ